MGFYTVRARPRSPCPSSVTREVPKKLEPTHHGRFARVDNSVAGKLMAVKVHADKQDDPKMTRRLPVVQCFRLPDMMPRETSRKPASRCGTAEDRAVQAEASSCSAHFLAQDGTHHGTDDITTVSGRQHPGNESQDSTPGRGRIMPLERDYSVHLL